MSPFQAQVRQTRLSKQPVSPLRRPSRSLANLFQGLCRCDNCGSPIYLVGRNLRGRQDRLVCSQKKKFGARACNNRTHYSVQRLEEAFLDQGLTAFSRASDFASARAEAHATAATLTQAEAEIAEAQKCVKNAQAMILRASTDDLQAIVMATLKDAKAVLGKAQMDRNVLTHKLDQLRSSDPDRLYREAEELAPRCLAGDMDARRRVAALLRVIVAQVRFGAECAAVESARIPGAEFQVHLGRERVPHRLAFTQGLPRKAAA
ncbi:zinc ribbon domain-containing protein [Belnapia sp. T6]|uniref:Zinc ribbon domain-containing protein n=1 Tax=Belnapia mucosa TaxID=2804532 RepID=A0ABS1UYS8_9PROT|nr:zinc ribbon domain-containing protein [Belnapia mucosa]